MKKLTVFLLVALFSAGAFAELGFLQSQTVSGLNKICVYSAPSGGFAITIRAHQLCPPTYER